MFLLILCVFKMHHDDIIDCWQVAVLLELRTNRLKLGNLPPEQNEESFIVMLFGCV